MEQTRGSGDRRQLREMMEMTLAMEDLKFITFDLSIDFETLTGETKSSKIISLIEISERYGITNNLIEILERRFPDTLWSKVKFIEPNIFKEESVIGGLRTGLSYYFSNDELRILVYDLGLDWHNLQGINKQESVLNLIQDVENRGQVNELIYLAKQMRPHVDWPSLPKKYTKFKHDSTDSLEPREYVDNLVRGSLSSTPSHTKNKGEANSSDTLNSIIGSSEPIINIDSNEENAKITKQDEIITEQTSNATNSIIDSKHDLQNSLNSFPNEGAIEAENTHSHNIETKSILRVGIRALADAPSEVDLLEFRDYADALAKFIRSEFTEKPLTISIDAPWGMGKTTLMHLIKKRLNSSLGETDHSNWNIFTRNKAKPNDKFPIVWFNAWKYEEENSLWAALVLEIFKQVQEDLSLYNKVRLWLLLTFQRINWSKIRWKFFYYLSFTLLISLLGAVGLLYLAIFEERLIINDFASLWQGIKERIVKYLPLSGIITIIPFLLSSYNKFIKNIPANFGVDIANFIEMPNYEERIGFLRTFEDDYKRIINVVTQNGKFPLIIFIDDLDRCSPPKPVEIMEAINILLDAEHCVFILGMDSTTVAASIEAKYKDVIQFVDPHLKNSLSMGHRFLEKIIQINFHIPTPDPKIVKKFISGNLTANTQKIIKSTPATNDQNQATTVQGSEVERISEFTLDSFEESEEIVQAINEAAPYLDNNPRKIKRFINLFRLQALIASQRNLLTDGSINLLILSKWLIIATVWPKFTGLLFNNPLLVDQLKAVRKLRMKYEETLQVNLSDDFPRQEFNKMIEQREDYKVKIEHFLSNPIINRYYRDDLLYEIVDFVSEDKEKMSRYLYLTEISLDRRSN